MHNYPLLASKQTFARIDFLRQGERLVDKKGIHNVKNCTEKLTDLDWKVGQFGLASWPVRVGELTSSGWRVDKFQV